MKPFFQAFSVWALAGCLCVVVQAQAPPPVVPTLRALRATTPPLVTADKSEDVWKTALSSGTFSVSDGLNASKANGFETQVRVLWDEQFLYVRFQGQGEEGFSPHGSEHDAPHHEGDVVEIFLDPEGDSREVIELQLNPQNGVLDGVHLLTAPAEWDAAGVLKPDLVNRDAWFFPSWNLEGLRTASRLENTTWTADIALPASLLKRRGIKAFAPMTLRANFIRYIHPLLPEGKRDFVALNWSRVPLGRPHRAFGALGLLQLTEK